MSGRIWVVEVKDVKAVGCSWRVMSTTQPSRDSARCVQQYMRTRYPATRVVQYVRQGGAR